ncbi:MAG: hypothetical protein ACPGSC_08690, partial [Granulosicoccaceae bacterium]
MGTNPNWQVANFDKFEPVDTRVSMNANSATIDMSELVGSWIEGNRPNYGWALTTTSSDTTKWISNPAG